MGAIATEWHRKSENHTRRRVETFGRFEWQLGAAEHPLETPGEVEVGEQSEVADFSESETEFLSHHEGA